MLILKLCYNVNDTNNRNITIQKYRIGKFVHQACRNIVKYYSLKCFLFKYILKWSLFQWFQSWISSIITIKPG